MNLFKPMLACKLTKPESLKFPLLCSQKLDGIRATVQDGKLLSRSLKEIPNVNVQRLFSCLPNGLDGELIVGNPFAKDCYRKTDSFVMSDDKPVPTEQVAYYVFDKFSFHDFKDRLKFAEKDCEAANRQDVKLVTHITLKNISELDSLEAEMLARGAEGVMLRSLTGLYKQGRSTEREGGLIKVKRCIDSEARIIGFEELMHNENEALENELGRTQRSSHKENLVASNTLGAFVVVDLKTNVEFKVGTGFTAVERSNFFQRSDLVGKILKYKYFPIGVKDKPRHPVFVGMRDERDM